MPQGFTSLDKSLLHKYFLNGPIFFHSFLIDYWGDPGVTCLISLRSPLCDWILWPLSLPRHYQNVQTHSCFSPRACFPDNESTGFGISCNLDRLRIFQIIRSWFLLFSTLSLSLYLLFHILLWAARNQAATSCCTFITLLRNLLS